MMKNLESNLFVFIILVLLGCEKDTSNAIIKLDYENIDLGCISKASMGGTSSYRITTNEEYDSLYNQLFTEPLESWLNDNYDSLIQGIIRNYPKACPSEYDSILFNDYIYNFAPYRYVKDCIHPEIDFDAYTLLGKRTGVSGCAIPTVSSDICVDHESQRIVFTTLIETYGSCEMGIGVQNWILVEKIDLDYEIEFKVEENNL